jgi:glutathione S-transferase
VALEEIGVPYEKVRVHLDKGEQQKPEFLAINPNGKVPVLVDGDVKIFESLACLIYLGERYGIEKGLWHKVGTADHGDALSWTVWASTELVPPMIEVALHASEVPWALPKEHRSAQVAEAAKKGWAQRLAILEKRLTGREWLAGKSYGIADLAVGTTVGMGSMMFGLPMGGANIGAWVGRVTSRPAFGRVMSEA